MTTTPSTNTRLTPAMPDEVKRSLRPLLAQFPSQDGDGDGKLLGYLVALDGEPLWSIDRAVRRYIRGEVREHDGRFLPSSAELARTTRAETDHARKMADWEARFGGRKAKYASPPIAKSDWRGTFPTRERFASWRLPAGALIVADDATVTMPDGRCVSWGELDAAARGKEQAREAA